MGISIRTWVSYGIITWNQSLDSNRPASAFFKKYKNSKSEDAKMHSNDPLPQRREVWGMAGLTASCSHQEEYVIKSNWYSPAVHGSEILRSPVEVGNFPMIYKVLYIPAVAISSINTRKLSKKCALLPVWYLPCMTTLCKSKFAKGKLWKHHSLQDGPLLVI